MKPDPLHPRLHSRLLGLLSQLGAVLMLLVLLGLHAPGRGLWLLDRLDPLTMALLGVWLLSALLVALAGWARDPARPHVRLTLGLVPMCAGVALAGIGGGAGALGDAVRSHCELVMGFGFATTRLQLLGLLGSAGLWLGMLPGWWSIERSTASVELEGAPPVGLLKRMGPHMGVIAAVTLWIVGAAWTLLDPLMPAKAAVGGQTVLGLWWLMAALPLLFVWARFVPSADDQALCGALAAILGFGVLGLSFAMLPRVQFLSGISGPGLDAALLVFAGGFVRMGPSLLVAVALSLAVSWAAFSPSMRRRVMVFGVVLAVAALLGLGQEMQLRDGLETSCNAPLHSGLQLPQTDMGSTVEPAALWVLAREGTVGAAPKGLPDGSLGLAADRRLEGGRLLEVAAVAARKGWRRFLLLHERPEPDEESCVLPQRLYLGLCPSRRRDAMRGIAFRLPRLEAQPGLQAGERRIMLNLVVDHGKVQLQVDSPGADDDGESLRAMGGEWAHDAAGLDRMAQALRKVKAAFPEARDLTVLTAASLSVARVSEVLLCALWDAQQPGRMLFPEVVLDLSQR